MREPDDPAGAPNRAGDTRRCIIGAVLRIIGRDGVAAVTNRRIAKEAGVSPGSVTYHFATQHDLLRESLLRFVAEETRRFTELAEDSRLDRIGLPEAAALVGQVAGGTEFDSEHIAPFELYVQAGRDERLRAAAAECFAAYDRLAARILTALGVADAERLAGTVVALVTGQQLRRLATGSTAEDLVDALLLLARGAAPAVPASVPAARERGV
ncbi:TetR/AcrR family transcriptional regulator [Streptomyces chrestomyceticus]|uniref:TetR/AcrR family transcriptional regulator n=1 Tax=Streptomyces chrestomyceticus TaxID=68185 RepID=UPI00379D91B3